MKKNPMDESKKHEAKKGDMKQDAKEAKTPAKSAGKKK